MSLVPPTQQSNHVNGVHNQNGALSAIPTLKDGYGQVGVPGLSPSGSQPFDFWGLLRRRIYLIALFAIVGAALGYLNYVKSPKVYSSVTRLLITTQAPPSIVNGNVMLSQKSSLPNHSSLLASEVVLANAIEQGDLRGLDTFSSSANPVSVLKSMTRVVPESGDSLQVVCSGANAEDLPIILSQIVESYRSVVIDDSQTKSEQTVSLIEALAKEMGDEKDGLESDRVELRSQLDVTSILENGSIVNPYVRGLEELRSSKDGLLRELSDLELRRKQLVESSTPSEDGSVDKLQIEVAAIEAREFLKIGPSGISNGEIQVVDAAEDMRNELQVLQNRFWDVESAIAELRANRVSRLQVVGPGHSSVDAIENQIKFRRRELATLQKEMDQLRSLASASQANDEERRTGLSELKLQESKNWIRMYYLALVKQEKVTAARIENLDNSIASLSEKAAAASDKIFQYNVIQKAIDKKEKAVDVILDRLKEINVLADNYTMTKIRTLEEPKTGFQIAPSFSKNLLLGTMLAGLCGLGLAYLVDQADMSFRSPAEILANLQMPVVGKIPRIRTRRIKSKKGNGVLELIAAHNPSASESEAFRTIRTNLFFRANNEDIKTILLTSPSPGDGKSTTAANLAISMAQAGKKVVLVDADFRRPRVDRYFGEDLENGFTDVLSGFKKLNDVIKPTDTQDGLYLITAGGHPKNPAELISSPQFKESIEALRESFDYVIVDSPPVLAVADSLSIASYIDGVYLVSRIRKGVKLTARKAKDSLEGVNAKLLGLIVNDVDQNPYYHEYGYQYRYYAYYGSGSYRSYYDSESGKRPTRIASQAGVKTN